MVRRPAPPDLLPVELLCNSARFLYAEDALASPASTRRWATDHGVGPVPELTEADVAALRAARETIRAFLFDPDDDRAREAVNALAGPVLGQPMLDPEGALVFGRVSDSPLALVVHPALGALVTAASAGRARRLKVCAADDCRWVYYDRSPAAASVWCDMNICGARHKMRALRSRTRERPDAPS